AASSGRAGQTLFRRFCERIEIRLYAIELCRRVGGLHHGLSQSRRGRATLRIPIDVFTRDPDSSLFPIESMQIAQMGEHDITDFLDGRRYEFAPLRSSVQGGENLTKDPRPTLCAAPDHQAIYAGLFKHVLRFRT